MTFTKRLKYHLITVSDVLQMNHVLGQRLMFHGPTISLSLPLHPSVHLFYPSPFLAVSVRLSLNLFCSSGLSSLILSDEDPSCPPSLLHGEMYANVADCKNGN